MFSFAPHKHGGGVYQGDAEAAQRRRTWWSLEAHRGEQMLEKDSKVAGLAWVPAGPGASSFSFLERLKKLPGDVSPSLWIYISLLWK